jgi:autotransporter-associated beta strand protein
MCLVGLTKRGGKALVFAARAALGACLLVSMVGLLSPTTLRAQTIIYWDTNGATSGASGSTTAAGTWDQSTTAYWSTSSAGTNVGTTWNTAIVASPTGTGIADFSAGSNATGAFTVTVSGTVTGVGGITFEEGAVTLGGTGTLTLTNTGTINVAATTATISAILGGSVGLTKTGAGTLVISSASTATYTGATNINAGTFQLGASNLIPNASAVTVISGATLDLNGFADTVGSIAGAGNITLGAVGSSLQMGGDKTSTTFSGVVSGSGFLQKVGSGTLTLSGVNTYTGATNINVGTVQLGAANAISSNSAVNVASGATFNLNNNSDTIGSLAGAGSVTLGTATLTAGADATSTTFSGVISGAGNLAKTGAGNLTLSGTNTYGGVTTISGGILTINADSNLGAAPGSVSAAELTLNGGTLQTTANMTLNSNRGIALGASGGTLDVNPSATLTYGGIVTGGGALTKADTGILLLSGVNTYTGATNINAGTVQLGAANAISSNSAVNVASGATFNLNGNSDAIGSLAGAGSVTLGTATLTAGADATSTTFSGVISGTGNLAKTGAGNLTLSGTNTYGGVTTISGGVLSISADSNLGAAPSSVSPAKLTLNGGTLQTTANMTLNSNRGVTLGASGGTLDVNPSATLTYGGIIAGGGALTKADTGTLLLSGVNTYTGATNINGGTLQLGAANSISSSSAVTVASGATFDLNSKADAIGSLAGAGNVTLGTATLTAGADGTSTNFSGVVSGTGGLTKGGSGTLNLSGANTYTGATTINAGKLQLGASGALSTSTAVTIASGATLNLNNYAATVGSLAGSGVVTLGSGTLTVGANNASTTFSGSFTAGDTGTFAKTGTGTLTLGTGMNLSAGTLVLNGGTLNLGGFTSTFGSLDVTANSILDFGTSGSSILNLTSLVINTGVTLTIANWTDAVDYFYSQNNPSSAILGQIVFNPPTYTGANTKWLSYDHQITPVPEPATYGAALMLLGLSAAAWLRRRRQSRA